LACAACAQGRRTTDSAARAEVRSKPLREAELNELLQKSRGLEAPYDGITEIWWKSADDVRAALGTPEGVRAMQELLEDESTFIDFGRSRVFLTQEHQIF